MEKYQEILRDQTSRRFASKSKYTSLLMLPLRLETKIMQKKLSAMEEPEWAFYVFQELWKTISLACEWAPYCRDASKQAKREEKEKEVIRQLKELLVAVEKVDLIYAEDKALLKNLMDNLYAAFDNVELQDALSPVIVSLDDTVRLTTIKDRSATAFLDEFEKMTKLFERTVNRPVFRGRKRDVHPDQYSHTIRLRTAKKHFRQCRDFLNAMEGKVNGITMITKEQIEKFKMLRKRWNDLSNKTLLAYSPLILNSSAPSGGAEIDAKDNPIPGLLYDLSKVNSKSVIGNDFIDALQVISSSELTRVQKNKYEAYIYLIKEACQLRIKLKKYNVKGQGWDAREKKLEKASLDRRDRYSVLASKLMLVQMHRMIASKYSLSDKANKKHWRKYKHGIEQINEDFCKLVYFDNEDEKDWLKKLLVEVLNMGRKPCKNLTSILDSREVLRKSLASASKKTKCLCIRIYPDVVSLTQAARQISRTEYLVGKDFWLKYIFGEDPDALWMAICDLYPSYRAAFILRRTFPSANYKVIYRKAKEMKGNDLTLEDFIKEIDDNFVNSFPTTYVDNGEELFSVPVTELLPDRFVVNASVKINKDTSRAIVRYGHRLPQKLQVGLDLNDTENATVESENQLFLNGNLRWMTDYDEAERMGMAITVPLDCMETGKNKRERTFEFDSIFVYGIHDSNDDEASNVINQLLTAHLYSENSMNIISFDTPTNILEEEKDAQYAFDSSEIAMRERFKHQAYNCVHPHKPEPGNDLDILDRLLCQKESVLGNIDDPNEKGSAEVALSRKVNELMLEKFIESNPLFKALKEDPQLKEYFYNDVLTRGPLPMLRISNQPYGILPVCDFKNLAFRKQSSLNLVKKILLMLIEHWNSILKTQVTDCYDDTIKEKDYLDILNDTPQTRSFYKRHTVKGDMINAEYFRGENCCGQIDELYQLARSLKIACNKANIKDIIPDYDYVPVTSSDEDDPCVFALDSDFENIVSGDLVKDLKHKIANWNNENPNGLQLSTDDVKLRELAVEFFDLFNYRLDAWIMGLVNNKLRKRMGNGTHRIGLGCFGWLFDLKENDREKIGCTNEYILAPSINHAVTGAILRSSYNNSVKKTDSINENVHDYDMGVNLSSERVRMAIRIIEGIQNGLSIGCILGSDMERFIHEAHTTDPELEMDACIYPLRQRYPLVKKEDKKEDKKEGNGEPQAITVLNAAKLLEDYKKWNNDAEIIKWLKTLNLFGDNNSDKKYNKLREIIDWVDDEYDALTDVVLSESVYRLTEGNEDASNAISRALDEMKNIPKPEVTEIPITSAQIDGYMLAMLPTDDDVAQDASGILASVEPKVDKWLEKMMPNPGQIHVAMHRDGEAADSTQTLEALGVSASELVYLSSDKNGFTRYLEVLNWLKNGSYETVGFDAPNRAQEIPVGVDSSAVADNYSLSECMLAIGELRKVLASSRALQNEDIVKETGLESEAVYSDMRPVYHNLEGYFKRLIDNLQNLLSRQEKMQDPLQDNYDVAALPDEMIMEAIRLLLDCYRAGLTNALDAVSPNLLMDGMDLIDSAVAWKESVGAQHALFQSMKNICDNISEKMVQAQSVVEQAAEITPSTYCEAIRKLLVSGFVVVPSFTPDGNVPMEELSRQATDGQRFKNVDSLTVEQQMADLALVEQPMMNLHQVRLFQKCNDIDDMIDVVPMQLIANGKSSEMEEWLGTEVSEEDKVTDAFVYMTMGADAFKTDNPSEPPLLSGLVIDHWVERIPYRNQTAAVAFGYDQPDAEAPQTLLLAVSTKDGGNWNEEMLVRTLKSAISMAKCRAVNPMMLSVNSWTSGVFPLLDYNLLSETNKENN